MTKRRKILGELEEKGLRDYKDFIFYWGINEYFYFLDDYGCKGKFRLYETEKLKKKKLK